MYEVCNILMVKSNILLEQNAQIIVLQSHPGPLNQNQIKIVSTSNVCPFLQEQTSMAKLGLELRLLSSDVDTEVEKWEEQEHDIVRQSQSLASMAYNMHLFTR